MDNESLQPSKRDTEPRPSIRRIKNIIRRHKLLAPTVALATVAAGGLGTS